MPSLQASLWIWEWREWQYLLGLVCCSIMYQILYWLKGAQWLKQLKMGTAFLYFMVLFQQFYPPLEMWHAGTGCLQGLKLMDSINCSWFGSGCGLCQASSSHPKRPAIQSEGKWWSKFSWQQLTNAIFSSWVNWTQGCNFFDLLLLSLGGSRAAWMLSLTTKRQNKDRCPWAWRSIGAAPQMNLMLAAWPWAMTLTVGMSCESCAPTNYVQTFADPQRAAGAQQYHPMLWIFHPKERRQAS